jgi:predicted O-methyltransferase YrrM
MKTSPDSQALHVSERSLGLKAAHLLSLLPARPLEFCDRISGVLEVQYEKLVYDAPTYSLTEWGVAIERVEAVLGVPVKAFLAEPELTEIEEQIELGIVELRKRALYPLSNNAGYSLARLLYLLCRAMRPNVVVETGVARGVSSAFILKAMEKNGEGTLHSIDLPPLAGEQDVGFLVPGTLRSRWRLSRGVSKRVLPQICREVGTVDIFIHDSLHTKANVRRELQTVAPVLAPRSIVVADDLQAGDALREWVAKSKPDFWAAVREDTKDGTFGVCVFNKNGAAGLSKFSAQHR